MNKPLLICITPVRNEAWILNVFLRATSLWADYIIIADQCSTDGSREIALSYPKVILIENDNPDFNEAERQKMLIEKARQIVGDKILFALDADEIFEANFMRTKDWQKIISSKCGDIFCFRWAQLLSDKKHYWIPNNYFPWVFHDDGEELHKNYIANIHSMRIPYPIDEQQLNYVNDFRVLHFQQINPPRNIAKQRFYMFVDYSMNKRSIIKLSRTYFQKKDVVKQFEIDHNMLYSKSIEGFDLFENLDLNCGKFWFDDYIVQRIKENGTYAYKNINIWNKSFIAENNFEDPRSISLKLLHLYLSKSQNISNLIIIRLIDKILKIIGL